jgi:hypothetical protein
MACTSRLASNLPALSVVDQANEARFLAVSTTRCGLHTLYEYKALLVYFGANTVREL